MLKSVRMSYAEPGAGSMESIETPVTYQVEMTKILVEGLLDQLRKENDKLLRENEALRKRVDELRAAERYRCRCDACERLHELYQKKRLEVDI